MKLHHQPWPKRLAFLAMAALLAYATFPYFANLLGAGVGFSVAVLYLLAFVLVIVAFPLTAVWLFSFIYAVVAKPYVRAWRINRIRSARYLKEASERSEEQD